MPRFSQRKRPVNWGVSALSRFLICLLPFLLLGCGSAPTGKGSKFSQDASQRRSLARLQADGAAREVVMYALGLLDVGYQFGGNNPEAGLDCSGMVRFIYREALGVELPHNAAALARMSQPVADSRLRAGDLVFFNTRGFSFSHVGIYLGDNKFIHAPSSRGRVRVESLTTPYFARRYEGGRTLLVGKG